MGAPEEAAELEVLRRGIDAWYADDWEQRAEFFLDSDGAQPAAEGSR